VVQLQIHLIQRLLHVLNVASRHIDEVARCRSNDRTAQMWYCSH
jgi:hypothetical protein